MRYFPKSLLFRPLVIACALALVAAGCGGGGSAPAGKPITLTIWKPFADSDTMRLLFDAYRKEHPNVNFEYTQKNIDGYEEDILNALAAGKGPDIFSINNSWLPKYLDKITAAPGNVWTYRDYRDAFVDVVVGDFTRDQKIYGIALAVDSLALYYNKDILGTAGIATPPKTWSELEADVRRVTRQDQTGYFTRSGVAMGTSTNVNRAADIVALLMLQAGAIPWSADGLNPTFAQSVRSGQGTINPGEAGLGFYTSFANPGNPNYTWNARSDYSIDAFANGRAAFLYSYTYARPLIISKAPNLNFDVAPVPQRNLDNPAVNYANYFGEVVNKQSPNAEVAWDFLKFATSKDSLDKYYARQKQPSSRKDLIELQIQDLEIGTFAHANLTAKSFYKPDEAKMNIIFNNMIDNVLLRGRTVVQALSQAQSEASVLTRNR